MSNGLLSIITVRSDSTRLPNKALLPIKSFMPGETRKQTLPLIVWLIRRCKQLPGALVAATTNEDTDNDLAKVMRAEGIEVVRGSRDDVIDRMNLVIMEGQYPGVTQVLRILGDCPYLEIPLVKYASEKIAQHDKDGFVYLLDPSVWPLYGSREHPLSLKAWQRIVRESPYREHPDQYFHSHRDKFSVVLHTPPPNIYFRNGYRTEIDNEADFEWLRVIAEKVGMLASLKEVINYLDRNESVARINSGYIEKTGPLSLETYSNAQRRKWLLGTVGQPVLDWSGAWITPPGKTAIPILCKCGNLLGHGWETRFYSLKKDAIITQGFVKCSNCNGMRKWDEAIPRAEKSF